MKINIKVISDTSQPQRICRYWSNASKLNSPGNYIHYLYYILNVKQNISVSVDCENKIVSAVYFKA